MAIISGILRKLRIVKPIKKEPVNINKDSKAVIDFLINLNYEQETMMRLFKNFLQLRLEFHALTDLEAKDNNLRHQINLFDQIIKSYSFFQGDADINGQRVKMMAKAMRGMALKSGDRDLIEKTNKSHWKFNW